MVKFDCGDLIRIERSPYLNGHFYFRLKKKCLPENDDLTITLGFGYDEPYQVENNNIFATFRMINAIVAPVNGKWVIYQNDHARNIKFIIPDKYHIITDWIIMSDKTTNDINISLDGKGVTEYFKKPFSPVSTDITDNCRSILLYFIKDSINENSYKILKKYLVGNPLFNDQIYGCIYFNFKDKQLIESKKHSCFEIKEECCKDVKIPKHKKDLSYRVPINCENN